MNNGFYYLWSAMNRTRIILFLYILCTFPYVHAQENNHWEVGINLGYNVTRAHTNFLFEKPAPFSFQLAWERPLYLEQRSRNRYGWTKIGVLFLYHDFRQPELGHNYSAYATGTFLLNPPQSPWQWTFRLGMGMAYNTRPFNSHYNTKNQLFGSHWLFPFNAGFYVYTPPVYKHWRLWTAVSVYHYSNGNLKAPNYGANIPGISLGLAYVPSQTTETEKISLPKVQKAWYWSAGMRFGTNQSDFIGSRVYPFFIPSVSVERPLNFRHRISLTAEVFVSYFLREQIRYFYYVYPEEGLQKIPDFKRAGLYAEHEFHYGTFGIDLGLGYYFYYPFHFESRTYNRLGLSFYAGQHWRIRYGVKLHSFSRAEALEIGIEYKIGKI